VSLGAGQEISIGDLAKALVAASGRDAESAVAHDRLHPAGSEVQRLLPGTSRARDLADWEPSVPLEEGLNWRLTPTGKASATSRIGRADGGCRSSQPPADRLARSLRVADQPRADRGSRGRNTRRDRVPVWIRRERGRRTGPLDLMASWFVSWSTTTPSGSVSWPARAPPPV
jgi:hypothetical protein